MQGSEPQNLEIHGFSDASNTAYAAVVYLKVVSDLGFVNTSFLYAKTKVAPLKIQSIPRLELCAALLLVRAIEYVIASMKLQLVPSYCWTDSSVVLSWLNAVPSRWKPFVINRIAEIHSTMPHATWLHVPTQSNPADCASRGITAVELLTHDLWWTGLPWLRGSKESWPTTPSAAAIETELEQRQRTRIHVCQSSDDWNLSFEISSWTKLLRVTAYVFRFVYNIRNPLTRRREFLSVVETAHAKIFWVKRTQRNSFENEIQNLQSNKSLKASSLSSLNPFLDSHGILCVGGRLRRSELCEPERFPMILPKDRLAKLIIRHAHILTLHGGLQLTLRILRQQYWILRARNLVKSFLYTELCHMYSSSSYHVSAADGRLTRGSG